MFAKLILVALLSLSVSVSAAPAADAADCTVTSTMTVAASATAVDDADCVITSTVIAAASATSAVLVVKASSTSSAATTSSTSTSSTSTTNLQTSLTLDSSLIQTGFDQDGQADGDPEGAGQVASNISANNFINFCAQYDLPLTNGTQITTGSCNAAPMGLIAATTAMPSSKFVNPKNLDTIPANQNFTIQMAISNLETGNFVNPDTNYFAAPQTVNAQGLIVGHSHVVIEAIDSLTQTTTTNPTTFAFFKGLNDAAVDGVLSTVVDGGLPAGVYRMASINAAANHQPALVAVAQHGSLDDMVYFTVSDDATTTDASTTATSTTAASSVATTTATSSTKNNRTNKAKKNDKKARRWWA